MRRHVLALLFALAGAAGCCGRPAWARSLYVAPEGSDGNPGSFDQPFATISHATSQLQPGDVLFVRGGIYLEAPTITSSGTEAAPIVIRSYPGERAIVHSGPAEFLFPGNSAWELVDAATGEYRSVRTFASSSSVYGYVDGISGYENERVLLVPYRSALDFRSTSDAYVDAVTPFYVGPGTFWDPADSRIHIRLAKTSDVRATEARYGAVFPTDLPDPRNYSIVLSQASYTLRVGGSHLTIKDLTLYQARRTLDFETDVHHVLLEGLTVWCGASSIHSAKPGVHDIKLTASRIYGDNPYWIFWTDIQDPPNVAGATGSTSVNLQAGTYNWEISYNHIRGAGLDLISTRTNETKISIHHNRIENCGDDAFELEGTNDVGQISIFENYIANCLVAIAPGQDSPVFTGPIRIYRNVIALLRNTPVNRKPGLQTWNGPERGGRYGFEYMFKHSAADDYNTRNVHIYHNTMVMLNSNGQGLKFVPKYSDNTYIQNNLMILVNGVVNREFRSGINRVIDANLYWKMNTVDDEPLLSDYDTVSAFSGATGLEAHGLGSIAKRGTDPSFETLTLGVIDQTRVEWELRPDSEVLEPSSFRLSAQSPARAKGLPLPASLPDTRSSLDLGAIPFDAPVTDYDAFPFTRVIRVGEPGLPTNFQRKDGP